MFLRNPMISWLMLFFAAISFVQYQPLRKKEDAQSPLMALGLGILGIVTINIPKMILQAPPAAKPTA